MTDGSSTAPVRVKFQRRFTAITADKWLLQALRSMLLIVLTVIPLGRHIPVQLMFQLPKRFLILISGPGPNCLRRS